jgi:hypothetical protein
MEPDQPMDELLKASARKRRAEFGSDPSMPNPMRVRLHEEITSVNREKEWPSRRFGFAWPRFALAAATAILIVGLPILWQWRESTHPKVLSATRQTETTAPASAAGARADEKGETAANQTAAAASETGKVAAAAAAPAAAKIAESRQQFARVIAQEEPGKSKVPDVLSNFQLEQNGDSVRVIDADGSTYTGKMERLALTDARALSNQKRDYVAQSKAASAAKKEKEEPTNEYYIRASGYNAQLKKPLSFEGNYIAEAPSANEMQDKDKAGANQARIVGTARIEGAPPVQVDAMAVPP